MKHSTECQTKGWFVIGGGPNLDAYKKLAGKNVEVKGYLPFDVLRKKMQHAKAFVFAADEDFGMILIEAQKCGCPVLSSDIPVLKEVLQDSAYYCNPYDINDISEKLQLLRRDNHAIVQVGYENVNRFSWQKSAMALAHVIEGEL